MYWYRNQMEELRYELAKLERKRDRIREVLNNSRAFTKSALVQHIRELL